MNSILSKILDVAITKIVLQKTIGHLEGKGKPVGQIGHSDVYRASASFWQRHFFL
jgi:hypothetical protein